MRTYDLALNNGSVILPDGSVSTVNIGVADQRIAVLSSDPLEATTVIDASGKTIIPGLIDQHFHSYLGYDFETHEVATRAAAKGGVTTVVEMPVDKPAIITSALFKNKLKEVGRQYHVDYAAIGGYVGGPPHEVRSMIRDGAVAIKIFTGDVAPPGMYPGARDGELMDLMRIIKQEDAALMVHCETADIVDAETARVRAAGKGGPEAWDEARPWFAEVDAVRTIALMAKVTGARVIVVHNSIPEAVDVITECRQAGADIWAETLPHQLCMDLERAAGDTRMKWNPPLRDSLAVDGLWKRLIEGKIHCIASDHGPLPKDKAANIWDQNPGAGNALETMLPVVATEAVYNRGVGLSRLVEVMCEKPAKILKLYPRKGAIQVGADADLVVLETNGSRTIDGDALEYFDSRAKWSPYHGREVKVYPVRTILRGKTVFVDGEIVGALGDGQLVTPSRARK